MLRLGIGTPPKSCHIRNQKKLIGFGNVVTMMLEVCRCSESLPAPMLGEFATV